MTIPRREREGLCWRCSSLTSGSVFFFFNDTSTTEIYTLSLHDALPISIRSGRPSRVSPSWSSICAAQGDRKSTRLNSSHVAISYAVFCLKQKNQLITEYHRRKRRELTLILGLTQLVH